MPGRSWERVFENADEVVELVLLVAIRSRSGLLTAIPGGQRFSRSCIQSGNPWAASPNPANSFSPLSRSKQGALYGCGDGVLLYGRQLGMGALRLR